MTRARRSYLAVWTCSQCDPGNSWDGIGRLAGASSGSTGRQDNKDGAGCSSRFTFLSTCSRDCGANATFSSVRRVTEPTPSQNGNGNPWISQSWQVTKETPLPRKTRWTKAKKCTIPSGSQLIEEGLSDAHLLGNREINSGYKDVPLQGIIFCGLCEVWSTSVLRLLKKNLHRPAESRTESAHQIVRWSGPATHLWFRELLLALRVVRAFFACRAQTASRCFCMPCCFTTWLSDVFLVTTLRYLLLCLIIVSNSRDPLPEPFWHRHSHIARVLFLKREQ